MRSQLMLAAFLALPYWLVMTAFVAFAVATACALHIAVHRTVPYAKLVEHNDVAGFMIAVVGVLYSVLIAFVVVVVWQQYNDSDANYGNEVAAAADIHAFADSLPPQASRSVRESLDRYVAQMIDDEWPAMRTGHSSAKATETLAQLTRIIGAVVPHSAPENDARTHEQSTVQRLFDLRNRRLSDNSESLPPVLWAALLTGAAITVGFGYLFGVKNFRIQLMMTGSVAALIAIMFTLLVELDYPFRRDTALSAFRWAGLQQFIDVARDAFDAPPHGRDFTGGVRYARATPASELGGSRKGSRP